MTAESEFALKLVDTQEAAVFSIAPDKLFPETFSKYLPQKTSVTVKSAELGGNLLTLCADSDERSVVLMTRGLKLSQSELDASKNVEQVDFEKVDDALRDLFAASNATRTVSRQNLQKWAPYHVERLKEKLWFFHGDEKKALEEIVERAMMLKEMLE